MTARYVDSTEQLVVELLVRDLRRSIAFYQALGFALAYQKDNFASVTWEDHRLFLDQIDRPEMRISPAADELSSSAG